MPVEIQERTFAAADGREMFARLAVPDAPRAALVIVHGFGEHSGRYLEALERFSSHGYATFVMDLRGFGRNARVMADMEDLALVEEDIRMFTRLAREETSSAASAAAAAGDAAHAEPPVILLGHSMGGLIALNQLLDHQSDYDLAVTSGPAILPPENASPFLIAVSGVLARFLPRLPVSKLEPNSGTRNEAVMERDRNDPYFYEGGFRARTARQLLDMQLRLKERMGTITLPLLALHGEGDRIITPRATEILVNSVSGTDVTKVIFPVLYHEILNEPEREIVYRTIFDWVDQRLESIAGGA